MFKNILVCLDGSALAEQILPYVTDEAGLHKSKVTLIQVVPSPVTVTPGVPGAPGGAVVTNPMLRETERAEKEASAYLEKVASPMKAKSVQAETATVIGSPGPGIASYAADNGCDLIAIATHGRSGLGKVVFGSVADYVLRNSGLPILLIKPH